MRVVLLLSLLFFVAVVSAKKQHTENVDERWTENRDHKKYGKEQKAHHHTHKQHKKHSKAEETPVESDPLPKQSPVDVPETEAELQSDIHTSRKSVNEQRHREQTEDLHLQDLAYEEQLNKEQKKHHKHGHHGGHQAEPVERKFFTEQESKHLAKEKVLEDSFETLDKPAAEEQKPKKNKSKNKKKAYEKSKSKNNKSKDSKKKNKGKNKKNKQKS